MKNAMKKLLSLALVAMLLVSVVPMGAMASEVDAVPYVNTDPVTEIPVQVFINDAPAANKTLTIKGWDPITLDESLARTLVSDWTNRTFVKWTNNTGETVTGNTLKNDEWLHNQSGYSLNLYLKQVDPAPHSKDVTVHVFDGTSKIATMKLTVASGGVTLNAGLMPIDGYTFVKWATEKDKDVTGSSYVVENCPGNLYLYVTRDNSGSTGGNTGSTLYRCYLNYFDANGNPVRQDVKDVKPNDVVNLGNDVQSYKIESGAKDNGANSVVITENNATISVYLKGNGTVTPPPTTGNTQYTYSVTVYDWNGKVIKDTYWMNAKYGETVAIQVDNFYEMKVNGVKQGVGVNYFTLNQNEARVEVRTTVNNGNVDPNPNPNPNPGSSVTIYFKNDKGAIVYQDTVTKGDSIGYNDVKFARNAVGDKSGYDFAGWRLNGEGTILSSETVAQLAQYNDATYYPVFTPKSSKFVNDIYLNIFVNGKADIPAKSIKLNDYTIISDDVINLDEVLTVVDDYYKASNTNKGLQLDGLYVAKGNFVSNWATDSGKSSSISGLKSMRYDSVVGINVMVNNAVAKTSSNADSSNPKTGDDIYMTVTVMGLSAAALCAVYYISKKRAVR